MAAWQDRVVAEAAELTARLDRLSNYLDSPHYAALAPADRLLLERQRAAMRAYETVLKERIQRFA